MCILKGTAGEQSSVWERRSGLKGVGVVRIKVQSLGWENLMEEEMASHSSITAERIRCTEEPGGLYSLWGRKSRTLLRD